MRYYHTSRCGNTFACATAKNLTHFIILLAVLENVPTDAGLQKRVTFTTLNVSLGPGIEPGPLAWPAVAISGTNRSAIHYASPKRRFRRVLKITASSSPEILCRWSSPRFPSSPPTSSTATTISRHSSLLTLEADDDDDDDAYRDTDMNWVCSHKHVSCSINYGLQV
jgi:hypothetical protein